MFNGVTLRVPADTRPRRNSDIDRSSEYESENLHPKLSKRRSSHLDLPATDDEDDILEVRPVTHLSRRTRRRFETRSCSVDYFTLKNREIKWIEKARGLSHEEIASDKSKDEDLVVHVPVRTRPRSNSSTGVSERRYQNQHLTGTSAYDLPPTDDEDEVLEEKPACPPGRKRNRFQLYSCPSNCYSPINDTRIKSQTDKALLQVPMPQGRFRSHSASELSERLLNLNKEISARIDRASLIFLSPAKRRRFLSTAQFTFPN